MKSILSVENFTKRVQKNSLPLNDANELNVEKIEIALEEATGIIASHLPWILNTSGDIVDPLPVEFANALKGACADIAFFRITDRISSSDDDRERYKVAIKLLETIAHEKQGGLYGPDYQQSELVIPNETENVQDFRYWKKGRML